MAIVSDVKPTPGLVWSLLITKARYENSWLIDFLGRWSVQGEIDDYGREQAIIIVSEDGSKKFQGTAEIQRGIQSGIQKYDYYESALHDAIDKAFLAFTKTLPRMDRIMRYGK